MEEPFFDDRDHYEQNDLADLDAYNDQRHTEQNDMKGPAKADGKPIPLLTVIIVIIVAIIVLERLSN